jgi:hypothetical protein
MGRECSICGADENAFILIEESKCGLPGSERRTKLKLHFKEIGLEVLDRIELEDRVKERTLSDFWFFETDGFLDQSKHHPLNQDFCTMELAKVLY